MFVETTPPCNQAVWKIIILISSIQVVEAEQGKGLNLDEQVKEFQVRFKLKTFNSTQDHLQFCFRWSDILCHIMLTRLDFDDSSLSRQCYIFNLLKCKFYLFTRRLSRDSQGLPIYKYFRNQPIHMIPVVTYFVIATLVLILSKAQLHQEIAALETLEQNPIKLYSLDDKSNYGTIESRDR